ncbi:MAG: FAD-binding oxidoreductase [Pseudomonadota bacterium]
MARFPTQPAHNAYDVVIIGGAMMGSSIAWHLSHNDAFQGRILVVERDASFEFTSTARTNSCIRQQFSSEINIRISQYGAEVIRNFKDIIGENDAPAIPFQTFGYMYLAADEGMAQILRESQSIQAENGAGTRLLTPEQIKTEYPFYNVDDIQLGSHNPIDEGYFDGASMFDAWQRFARHAGVEYIEAEVASLQRNGSRIEAVTLADGTQITAGQVVNAAGPRASGIAAMADVALPVEPRRRYTFIFAAAEPLKQDLPLTIDPSGVHMRSDGVNYLAGCPPWEDPAVDPNDFEMDHTLWEDKVWPALAGRVPAFERIKLLNTWVGHYAYNTLDQNAIIGHHPDCANMVFANGFSGHGFQQAAAVGRGVGELIAEGDYRSLDLSPLGCERLINNTPLLEKAVI